MINLDNPDRSGNRFCPAVLLSRDAMSAFAWRAEQIANGIFAATALRNADVVHAMGMQPAVVALHDRRQDV
jgi:ABC-type protease/lipase transport system fused ATPase/permease subunit